jgi:hypothetical protein
MDPILSKKLQSFSPLLVRAFLKLISLSRPSLSTPLPSSPSSSGSSFEQSGSPLGAKDGKVLGEKEGDTLGVKEGEELEDTDIMRESRLGKNLVAQIRWEELGDTDGVEKATSRLEEYVCSTC